MNRPPTWDEIRDLLIVWHSKSAQSAKLTWRHVCRACRPLRDDENPSDDVALINIREWRKSLNEPPPF